MDYLKLLEVGNREGLDVDNMEEVTADPIGSFLEKVEANRILGKAVLQETSWNEPLAKAAPEKPFANPLGFEKSSIGYKLKIVRVEDKRIEDGTRWAYAYNEAGDLVDAKFAGE
jgi:hypothetical protein